MGISIAFLNDINQFRIALSIWLTVIYLGYYTVSNSVSNEVKQNEIVRICLGKEVI